MTDDESQWERPDFIARFDGGAMLEVIARLTSWLGEMPYAPNHAVRDRDLADAAMLLASIALERLEEMGGDPALELLQEMGRKVTAILVDNMPGQCGAP